MKKQFSITTIALITIIFASLSLFSGEAYQWPLSVGQKLSGTLGEKRGGAFHHGIDIKTNGRNGYPVSAIRDGRVIRIISRRRGYGNAITLGHSNGLYSLYAHMDDFEDPENKTSSLAKTVKSLYNSRDIDFRLYTTELYYKQGRTIGFSGESGSGFPHLHFAINNSRGSINPLKYLSLADSTNPTLKCIYLCLEKENTTIYEKRIMVEKSWGRLRTYPEKLTIPAGGKVFLKISCYDSVGAQNKVAPYKIELKENSNNIFSLTFDNIGWKENRYGKMIYDIAKTVLDGNLVYTYLLCKKNINGFSGIKTDKSRGYLVLENGKSNISITVSDHAGNSSKLSFQLQRETSTFNTAGYNLLRRNRSEALSNISKTFTMYVRPWSISTDTFIKISDIPTKKILARLEKLFFIKRKDVASLSGVFPFDMSYRKPVRVVIKRPAGISRANAEKYFIYNFFDEAFPGVLKTVYNTRKDRFEAWTWRNGYFALIRDTRPPWVTIPPTHEFTTEDAVYRKIRFILQDNLSGISLRSVTCFIDGEQYPYSFDMDRGWIEFALPGGNATEGLHHILIRFSDRAQNKREFRGIFGF